MADKTYALDFTLHDPKTGGDTTKTVTFTSPQGPQGVQGPTGEKGDSYGVFVREAKTRGDLYDIVKGLTDTQKIISVIGNCSRNVDNILTNWSCQFQIQRLIDFDASNIIFQYTFSANSTSSSGEEVAVDNYFYYISEGDSGSFTMPNWPISGTNTTTADSVSVFIYDSSLSGDSSIYEDEALPSPQTKVPYYASYYDLPTDRETAFSDFGLADGLPSNGRLVALFAFIGDELLLVEVEESDPLVWSNLSEAKAIKQGQHVIVEYGGVPTPPADVFFIKDATSGESKDADVVYDNLAGKLWVEAKLEERPYLFIDDGGFLSIDYGSKADITID